MSILFKNAKILIRENGYKVIDGFLGVKDEYIDYIGTETPKTAYDHMKDMGGKLLMPGLVNIHGHSAMTLVRGAGSGLPLDRWLNEAIFPVEANMKPEDIIAGDKLAIMEMIAGGTTQVADMYDFPFAGAYAYADTGMKVNLCRVGLCFDPSLEPGSWPRTAECINFINIVRGDADINGELLREIPEAEAQGGLPDFVKEAVKAGRIIPDFCLHSEYLTTEKFVRAIEEANRTMKARVHVHISETKKEHEECIARHGRTPVKYLADMGILDNPTYAAHCVWVTDEDMEIMKAKDFTLAHNPTSNLKLGSGVARISKALEMGINVGLGTDGVASNNNLDMWEEMHLAALLQKGINHDPTLVSDAQVIDMATINGAKALGRPDTGELAVGKKADIIALDFDKPHLTPAFDIPALLVYSAQASDVCMTMVDGKVLYENGEFKTIDADKAYYEIKRAADRLKG